MEHTPAEMAATPLDSSPRIALRFLCIYFGGYILSTKIVADIVRLPHITTPTLGLEPVVSNFVLKIAHLISPASGHLEIIGGSGDKLYDWVLNGLVLIAATIGAGVWALVEPRIDNQALLRRVRLVLRIALGATLIEYGSMKFFPDQMPEPSLLRLLEPYGHFSMFSSLWANIGASPSYEMVLGTIEMVTGVLIIVPKTALLGALVAVGVTGQIVILNLTYDVPVKLFSFNLLLMALVLVAPDARRIWQAVTRQQEPTRKSWAFCILGLYLIGFGLWRSERWWRGPYGSGAEKTPLYGIWTIERMTIDGIERAPLVTDYDRWRRVVIQSGATGVRLAFWRMNDTADEFTARIDVRLQTIIARQASDPRETILRFTQTDSDHIDLEGIVHGRSLRMETRAELASFPLLKRNLTWIQEHALER